ncbi:hypothetical protein CPT_Suzuki_002 [Stenotrophomonas phage Suzuki]|nr:hypothetical protein CPT_Suzuki_002 [Stenotrophomonas phage Suzuki]
MFTAPAIALPGKGAPKGSAARACARAPGRRA